MLRFYPSLYLHDDPEVPPVTCVHRKSRVYPLGASLGTGFVVEPASFEALRLNLSGRATCGHAESSQKGNDYERCDSDSACNRCGRLCRAAGGDPAPQSRAAWMRPIADCLFTIVVAFEMTTGALWDFLKIEYARVISAHLGYPHYMGDILGIPRIPCALALLAPRFPRLRSGPMLERFSSMRERQHHKF